MPYIAFAALITGCNGELLDVGSTGTPLPPIPPGVTGYPNGSIACPNIEPALHSPCDGRESQQCEYDGDEDGLCQTHVIACGPGDRRFPPTWERSQATRPCDGGFLPGSVPDFSCPPSMTDIADGEACDQGESECAYPDGTCACTRGPRATDPARWRCITAPPGCPARRPRYGSACVGRGACDYGLCTFQAGRLMVCDGTQWTYNRMNPGIRCD